MTDDGLRTPSDGVDVATVPTRRWARKRWLIPAGLLALVLILVGVGSTDDEPLDTYLGSNIRSSSTLIEDAELVLHGGCMYLSFNDSGDWYIPYFNALTVSFDSDAGVISRLFGASYGVEGAVSSWRGSIVKDLPGGTLVVRGHASVCEESSSGFILLD